MENLPENEPQFEDCEQQFYAFDQVIGKCQTCGCNLYIEDDPDYCDHCIFAMKDDRYGEEDYE